MDFRGFGEFSSAGLSNSIVHVTIDASPYQLARSSPCKTTLLTDKLAVDTALAVGNTAAEFDAFIKAEQARWKPVIARAQIRPEGA